MVKLRKNAIRVDCRLMCGSHAHLRMFLSQTASERVLLMK